MAEKLETTEDWQAGRSLAECNKFMLSNEINSDVTFLVGQRREPVRCHKYMLISRSTVFQSIFCGSISSDSNGTFPVSDIDPATFRSLLMFIYADQVSVTADNVNNLLFAAKKYAVKGLVDQCLNFLKSSLCPENVCNILEQVHQYDGKDLEAQCVSFVFDNAGCVLPTKGFEDLCAACVEQIVRSDELVLEERLVFEAVTRWATAECQRKGLQVTDDNQRKVLGTVLFHVRFPLLNTAYFTNYVSTRELLQPHEVIAIFQFFNGRTQPSNWKFNTNRRRGFSLFSVLRYNLILMEEFPCDGENHSVSFTCSEPVLLHGAIMYGCLEGSVDYTVKIELRETIGKTCVQCAMNSLTLSTTRAQHTYDLIFTKPVTLCQGKVYTVRLKIDGPPSKVGFQGKADVTCEGVTFHFINMEGSKTNVEKGQIPGLLFTLPSSKQRQN